MGLALLGLTVIILGLLYIPISSYTSKRIKEINDKEDN